MKKLLLSLCALATFVGSYAQEVSIESFANGFTSPVNLQHAGDDRLFVVEQAGRIKILNADGTTNATPFLDISSLVTCCGERGLLGLAFHPNYDTNGFFYVNYTFSAGANLFTQISRFSVDPANPDLALSGSELKLLDYLQEDTNHNGGCIAFGPDGYLYIASGDGGGGGDPNNRAQDNEFLLGKLLRIDVDNPSGGNNYGIPPDNPFAGNPPNAPEIWAYGLRNPWKFSFDRLNGDLWIGDVGQGEIEEVNRVSSTEAGLNYGWDCFEGTQAYTGPPGSASPVCTGVTNVTFPITEYSSASGSPNCSVTGGYVYRGNIYSDILGFYIFADFCSGKIFTSDQNGNMTEQLDTTELWSSFGEDNAGELYIVDLGGTIYKIEGGELLGTTNPETTPALTMYPNPATNKVTLKLSNDLLATYAVMDMKGSVLIEQRISAEKVEINVADLSQGIYLLKVTTQNNTTLIKKLVVE